MVAVVAATVSGSALEEHHCTISSEHLNFIIISINNSKMRQLLSTLYRRLLRETLLPLALMVITPNAVILLPYIVVHEGGSLRQAFARRTLPQVLLAAWRKVDW